MEKVSRELKLSGLEVACLDWLGNFVFVFFTLWFSSHLFATFRDFAAK